MNPRMTFISITLGLVLSLDFCCAQQQEVRDVLARIADSYKLNNQYGCNFKVVTFEGYEGEKAESNTSGYFYRNGKKSYTKIDNLEMISCVDFALKVDSKENEISYYPKTSYGVVKDPFVFEVDSLLKLYTVVSMTKSLSGKEAILLENENSVYEKMYLEFEKKTFLVEKIVLYLNYGKMPVIDNVNYWSSPSSKDEQPKKKRIEMEYKDVVLGATMNENVFLLKTYVVKNTNKKLVCSGAYKNFKLR